MKLRTGMLLGTAFVAGLAAGPAIGWLDGESGIRLGVNAAMAQNAQGGAAQGAATPASPGTQRAEIYNLLTLFGDVFERVRADYVEPVNDRDAIENAINGMLTGLDPHSSYMNAKSYRDMQVQTHGEFGGLGIEVTEDNGIVKVVSPIDDTPAARAGIKPGDLITAIDGQTVQGLSLNDAVDKMRGKPNTQIKLTLKREGVNTPVEVTLTREVIHIQVVKSASYGDIGYIRLTQFNEQTDPGLRDAFQKLQAKADGKLRGLVLDLRNNPGGLLDQAVAVSDDLIDQGEIVSTRARHPEDSQRWDAKAGDITNGLPIVVLTNGGSASASEIVSGALQDHRRAVLVGTRTFGKGSVQTVIPLQGGAAMRLTTARYYTPSGRSIQGLGIAPDIEVRASRTEVAHFGPERESDLRGALRNQGGTPQDSAPKRDDLPPIAASIPKMPPEGAPAYDATKPDTDFQLQQGLAVVRSMADQKHAGR